MLIMDPRRKEVLEEAKVEGYTENITLVVIAKHLEGGDLYAFELSVLFRFG